MDLYNREIVSYEVAEHPLPTMIESMLTKAFDRLGSRRTDRRSTPIRGGSTACLSIDSVYGTRGLCKACLARPNCLDDAAMESFFGALKCELFYINEFESVETLKGAIHEYIGYYNVDRIKLGLGGLSPVEYRERGTAQR